MYSEGPKCGKRIEITDGDELCSYLHRHTGARWRQPLLQGTSFFMFFFENQPRDKYPLLEDESARWKHLHKHVAKCRGREESEEEDTSSPSPVKPNHHDFEKGSACIIATIRILIFRPHEKAAILFVQPLYAIASG